MSGEDSFYSFANFVKDGLAALGSDLTVGLRAHKEETAPYLILQLGPNYRPGVWVSKLLVTGWLVVEKENTEDLLVTTSRYIKEILSVTQDSGMITKYDYSVTPEKDVGSIIPKLEIVSEDRSNDPLRSRRMLRWVLYSNAGVPS